MSHQSHAFSWSVWGRNIISQSQPSAEMSRISLSELIINWAFLNTHSISTVSTIQLVLLLTHPRCKLSNAGGHTRTSLTALHFLSIDFFIIFELSSHQKLNFHHIASPPDASHYHHHRPHPASNISVIACSLTIDIIRVGCEKKDIRPWISRAFISKSSNLPSPRVPRDRGTWNGAVEGVWSRKATSGHTYKQRSAEIPSAWGVP